MMVPSTLANHVRRLMWALCALPCGAVAVSAATIDVDGTDWTMTMSFNAREHGGVRGGKFTTVDFDFNGVAERGVPLSKWAGLSGGLDAVHYSDDTAAVGWEGTGRIGEQAGQIRWKFTALGGEGTFAALAFSPAQNNHLEGVTVRWAVSVNGGEPVEIWASSGSGTTRLGFIDLMDHAQRYYIGTQARSVELIGTMQAPAAAQFWHAVHSRVTSSRHSGFTVNASAVSEPIACPRKASLQAAIRHLAQTFGSAYPQADEFLARLDELNSTEGPAGLDAFRREALLANPLVAGQPILFIVRPQYINTHGAEATMYQTGEIDANAFRGGGAMKLWDPATGQVTTLLEAPEGIIRDPEVHFDGQRILFSMRHHSEDDYSLYELDVSGGSLRQLTFGARVSDYEPIYLPDESIVFSSTRDPTYIPCQRNLKANLFRLDPDGRIRQLGFNNLFEGRASLMPDGRILYTRWEYVDKHFASAYGLWTVNPDGTNHALYYGNYAWQPSAIFDGRIIPGTDRFVAVFGAVHDLARGAIVVGDRRLDLDGMAPILHSWPADIGPYMQEWDVEGRVGNRYDSFMFMPHADKYEAPYPLSEHHFLCARPLAEGKHTGLFLVDTFGNEVLLHEEAPGCFDPVPLRSRPRPPVHPSRVDLSRAEGEFYVQNVYLGRHMERVEPGSAKYLRVVEAPPMRTWVPNGMGDWAAPGDGDSHHPVALNWNHYNNKRILGTVPVEPDGSAYFTVPAGRFVYFQLLDENRMMIQSMRSGTMLQPGERLGCVGCHENRLDSPPVEGLPAALRRPPSSLADWYGPAREFSYAAEVQPVLDSHCVRCHDHGGEARALNLSGDKGLIFNHSYVNLMRASPALYVRAEQERADPLPLVSSVGSGPMPVLPPYSWGSHRSRLVHVLREGHHDVKLDAESLDRIVTWIDLNAPYYPSQLSYYYRNTAGRSPLNHQDLLELGRLVQQSPAGSQFGWDKVNEYVCNQIGQVKASYGPPVNFTRPEKSLCLTGFRTPATRVTPGRSS
jgi:hypothetical protein